MKIKEQEQLKYATKINIIVLQINLIKTVNIILSKP